MIKDQKELQALLKLCRKQGVTEISFEGVSIKFGDLPTRKVSDGDVDGDMETDEPTPEELMFFSAPRPEGN